MNSVFHLYNGDFYVWGIILLVKSSYYGMAYVMYNEIKYRHKGESNIWITIITGIYYIDVSGVISYVLGLNLGKCL